jgi:hypothetical protein
MEEKGGGEVGGKIEAGKEREKGEYRRVKCPALHGAGVPNPGSWRCRHLLFKGTALQVVDYTPVVVLHPLY